MQKIISLFQRNYGTDFLVRDELVPGAEWVIAGEGFATRKWDGTCCRIENGVLFKRYELKPNKQPPDGFILVDGPDSITGNSYGWLQCSDRPEDRWFHEGFANTDDLEDGTWELIGPKINGNREDWPVHELMRHGADKLYFPKTISFDFLKKFLYELPMEGIVWHHPDGRMVKIKRKDFGLKW